MWEKKSIHVKSVTFIDDESMGNAGAVLNASIFYWWYIVFSNCRDLVKRKIDYFPLSNLKLRLSGLYKQFNESLESNKYRKETYYKATGKVIYDEYYPKLSKPIIDQIDAILAQHYGFTQEELDFIINYDIKYRMSKELSSREDNNG